MRPLFFSRIMRLQDAGSDTLRSALVTSSISPLTNYETSALNFARIIQRHAKVLSRSDALNALQYLYLICFSADAPAPIGKEQVELCHESIRELVVESGSYAELLGDIKVDGTRIVSGLPPSARRKKASC